jgi:DEAD/DEAH box helicase domain-containing protein
MFGPTARAAVDALVAAGLLRRRPRGWFWTDRRRASDLADLRSSGGPPVRLVEVGTGRVLGTVDQASAHGTVHPGAVYLHQGETYVVLSLDLDENVAMVLADEPDYSTNAREVTDVSVVAEQEHELWGAARVSFGDVRVRHQVTSFLKRAVPSGELLGEEPLNLPERTLHTKAVWWSLPSSRLAASELAPADLPGAAHAAEHASIGLLPLFATCDRWDIGGVSTALHQDGCPSCVQSPKCGNGNSPLDKPGAVTLLDVLLEACPDPSRPGRR